MRSPFMQVMFVCLFFSTIISICAQEEKKLEKHFFFLNQIVSFLQTVLSVSFVLSSFFSLLSSEGSQS